MNRPTTFPHLLLSILVAMTTIAATNADENQAPIAAAKEQDAPATELNILFIGNSYTYGNDLPGVLTRLAATAKPTVTIKTDKHTPGGCTFEKHWKSGKATAKIREQKWDVVVLQEQSMMPIVAPKRMHEFARPLHAEIEKNEARTVFFMTWARAHKPETIDPLADAYTQIAEELEAEVAPVGRAWQAMLKEHPTWKLHQKDQSHPTELGTYLAASVFYATLTGRDPAGLSTGGLKRITPDQQRACQTIAWEIVNQKKTPADETADSEREAEKRSSQSHQAIEPPAAEGLESSALIIHPN